MKNIGWKTKNHILWILMIFHICCGFTLTELPRICQELSAILQSFETAIWPKSNYGIITSKYDHILLCDHQLYLTLWLKLLWCHKYFTIWLTQHLSKRKHYHHYYLVRCWPENWIFSELILVPSQRCQMPGTWLDHKISPEHIY